MGDEPGAPPLEEEETVQSRSFAGNSFGFGYTPQGGGRGGMPFIPGYGYPSLPRGPPPYEGTGPSVPPGYGYQNPYPYPSATMPVSSTAPPSYVGPPGPGAGNGGGLYPEIGFNSGLLLSTSKSYMECPVCMEVLIKPIYQCSNGHIICNKCIERLDFCGQCRVSLGGPKIRNVALEQISETMEVKCPNHLEGCGMVASGEQLKSHLDVCEFRAIQLCSKFLGYADCPEKVTSVVATVHLQEAHQAEVVINCKFSMKLISSSSTFEMASGRGGATWGPIVIASVFDSDIVLKCEITPQGYLNLTGYLIGCSEESHKDYRVKFQIDSQRSRLEWTGALLSIRHHNFADHLPNLNTFQVPLPSLKEFTKPYHNPEDDIPDQTQLKVKVAFWKLSDDNNKHYKECFTDFETLEKEPLEKLILPSKPYTGQSFATTEFSVSSSSSAANTSFPGYGGGGGDYSITTSTAANSSYPLGNSCTQCNQPLYGIIYQCLQCPEGTYFCRQCTEVSRVHSDHLTLRISSSNQLPLASVVYECASGDIS